MSIIRNGFESADLDVPVVLPTLNLDFANSQSLDKRITFSRGSIGTRVNRNGLIETIAANQPRFDFDPISGECRGLLIEESRSNYFWGTQTGGGGSVTNGTATGADGITAKKFVPTLGSTAFPGLGNYTAYTFTAVSGGTVDVSFSGYFASVANGLYFPDIVIEFNTGGTTNNIYAELSPDLTNGTVWYKSLGGSGSFSELIAPQITLMPFGMYKVTWSIRYTQGATIRDRVHFYIQCRRKGSTVGSNTGTYYADGVNGFQFSCVQYEIGALPTSYIPTTTSAVTRSVDNAEMTGTNFSSWYNQAEGTFFYNGTLPFITNDTVGRVPFGVSNGFNFSNSMYVAKTPTTLGLSFTAINNNVAQTTGTSLPTMTSSKFKIASSVAPNNIYSCGYGGVVNKHSKTSAAIPPATRLTLGKEPWNGSALNPIIGCINKFAYYPKALSPAELQYLTQ
jgi:hypothetical protein